MRAVIVGPLQFEFSQRGLDSLPAPVHVASRVAAPAKHSRVPTVGVIGVEPVLNQACCPGQHGAARRHLQRLEVQFLERLTTQQRGQFFGDFTAKFGAECGFSYPRFEQPRAGVNAGRRSVR